MNSPEHPKVLIKYKDNYFFCNEEFDVVCRRLNDSAPLDVWFWEERGTTLSQRQVRISFYSDPDWVRTLGETE